MTATVVPMRTPRLPRDSDAELALAGAVMLDAARLPILRRVAPKFREHRALARVILAVADAGEPLDAVRLRRAADAAAERQHPADDAARVALAGRLYDAIAAGYEHPRGANVEHYARLVEDAAYRREAAQLGSALAESVLAGDPPARIAEHLDGLRELRSPVASELPAAVDLYGDDVEPTRAEFLIEGLLRKGGLTLLWSVPNLGKTGFVLRVAHETAAVEPGETFLGHPRLTIREPIERVLLITTEETSGDLRHYAEAVEAGMGEHYHRRPRAIQHLFAVGERRITLDDLPAIVDRDRPDLLILDSLTGLRPKTVNGVAIRWDVDNDAANEMLLGLRGLAARTGVSILLVHHSDKSGSNYRGPTDWWASVDVMFGLMKDPDDERYIRVWPQKVRGGRVPDPFRIEPCWSATGDALELAYAGTVKALRMPPSAAKLLSYLKGAGEASLAEMTRETGLHRDTVRKNVRWLVAAQHAESTGGNVNGSPVFRPLVEPPKGTWSSALPSAEGDE